MSTNASGLAQALASQSDEDIVQAVSLLISMRPELQSPLSEVLLQVPAQRFTGAITCFYPEKHFGFIKCDEVHSQYAVDTFLSENEIGSFQVGSVVTFSMVLNKAGKPQARLLAAAPGHAQPRPRPPPAAAPRPVPPPAQRGPPVVVPPIHVVPSPQPASAYAAVRGKGSSVTQPYGAPVGAAIEAASDERHVGKISAFNPERHFGFIVSETVKEIYGVDTFLSDKEIGTFQLGDLVSFTVQLNGKGQPQARGLEAVDEFAG